MKILFQFPDGLKQKALSLIEEYLKKHNIRNAEVYISASRAFGGCDIPISEAGMIGADKIVHFGHSKFVKEALPVKIEYEEYHINVDKDKLIEEVKKKIHEKRICLAATVQHIHEIDKIAKKLMEIGKDTIIEKGWKTTYPAQILGCDYGAITKCIDKCDAVLIIGSGRFHYIDIDVSYVNQRIPIYVFNPFSKTIKDVSDEIEKWKKRKRGILAQAITAKRFGILISIKPGQYSLHLAKKVKKELEELGKECVMIVGDTIDNDTLINMDIDCYITTACPRIMDNYETIDIPILDIPTYVQLIEQLKSKY